MGGGSPSRNHGSTASIISLRAGADAIHDQIQRAAEDILRRTLENEATGNCEKRGTRKRNSPLAQNRPRRPKHDDHV